MIFRRIVLTAFISGTLAGLALAVLQGLWVVPLLLEAERYERTAAPVPAGGDAAIAARPGADQPVAQPPHGSALPSPAGVRYAPLRRTLLTAVAEMIAGFAFALILVGCIALRGRPVGPREGLAWGLAGYAVFVGAPALGLPPELPGMAAAALGPRQVWWLGTLASTGAGLALAVFARSWPLRGMGLVLLIFPHLAGAPHLTPDATPGAGPPAELAQRHVGAVLATLAVFWLLLGLLVGWGWRRLRPPG